MGRLNKKGMLLLLTGLIITLFAATNVYANAKPIQNTVKAYSGVKILYNGNELTGEKSPYIIDDTTYIPLRMLMENFGKYVFWDAANYRVIITDGSEIADLKAQITQKNTQIASLQQNIKELNAQISDLKKNEKDNDQDDLEGMEDRLSDAFEDAGYDYFADAGIETSFSLSGNKDKLNYTIRLDFRRAKKYDDLAEITQKKLKTFLDDVRSKVNREIRNTKYKNAEINGRLNDRDTTKYYVKDNGRSYSFSWDEKSTSVSEIQEVLRSSFKNAGSDYFNDSGIKATIDLSGSKTSLAYNIKLDFSKAKDYTDLSELSTSKLKTFLNAVKSGIDSEIDGTAFEGAKLSGKLSDSKATYYVKYDNGTYSFNWK
jgi:TolA-binding protein